MSRFDPFAEDEEPPEDLTAWLSAGIRRVDALNWRRWNFDLSTANRWRRSGVDQALTAMQWQVAGVNPDTVAEWRAAGIGPAEAIRWREFGFDLAQAREHLRNGRNADDAYHQQQHAQARRLNMSAMLAGSTGMREFMNAGVPHRVLAGYLQLHWVGKDALAWAKLDIDAWNARAWQQLGLTPAEAAELESTQQNPMQVVRDWWRAGIPYDEVADWIGAGLAAEEAAAQRESGVTVEQAAALRALRRGGAI